MSNFCLLLIIYPKLLQSMSHSVCFISHFSCSVCCHFSLIGLSLFTWHCPPCHRTSSQRSHLPNRHIHSLQKCQADKVSNLMLFWFVCFVLFFFFSCLETFQEYVKSALCFGASVFGPSNTTLSQEFTQGVSFWRLLWAYKYYKTVLTYLILHFGPSNIKKRKINLHNLSHFVRI